MKHRTTPEYFAWAQRFARLKRLLRRLRMNTMHMAVAAPNRLEMSLPSDYEMLFVRTFAAPRERVFEAFTKPELLKQWWGRTGSTLPVCEVDLRPGGAYRFVERQTDGSEYGFRGVYREIVPPEQLVWTFVFDPMPGHVSINISTFAEHGGGTKVTSLARFLMKEDRDGMAEAECEKGAEEAYARLDALLERMR